MLGNDSNGTRLPSIDDFVDSEQSSDRSSPRLADLVSIIVPCSGQAEYTQLCVPSVLRHTRAPYELVFLDFTSLDGTWEYLEGIKAAAPLRVELVRVPEDAAYLLALAEGIARSRGRYLVTLGNDTIVTPGWLNQLTTLAIVDTAIGGVGPMSNYAAPAQWAGPVPYRISSKPRRGDSLVPDSVQSTADLLGLTNFAASWHVEHRGQWTEVESLDAFCGLFKREVFERIGPLLELTAPISSASGQRLDRNDLLCQRSRQAGFRLACCRDLFVHHFGSRSASPRRAQSGLGARWSE